MTTNSVNYQDWEDVVLKKQVKKSSQHHHQNPEGTKQFRALDADDIPKIAKFTTEQLNFLKDLRRLKNKSQEELAKLCNINVAEIKRLESNQMPLNMKFYNNLIRKLNSIQTTTS